MYIPKKSPSEALGAGPGMARRYYLLSLLWLGFVVVLVAFLKVRIVVVVVVAF